MQTFDYVSKLHSHTKMIMSFPIQISLGLSGLRIKTHVQTDIKTSLSYSNKRRACVYPDLLSVIFELEARTCFDMLSRKF